MGRRAGRVIRRATGGFSRMIGGRRGGDDAGDYGYQGIDPSQYQALQNQLSALQNQYNQMAGTNQTLGEQYSTLTKQFDQLMNQYKALTSQNTGLKGTIADKDNIIRQKQLETDSEKSKLDALNKAIAERGKFDLGQESENSQAGTENNYGVDPSKMNMVGKVGQQQNVEDDDDIKRRLSRVLQERGQLR